MTKTAIMLALAVSAAIGAFPSLAAAQSFDSGQQQRDASQQRIRGYNNLRAAYDQQQQREQSPHDNRPYDSRGYDSRDDSARRIEAPCHGRSNDNPVAAGIFGALAGAAVGGALSERGSHTEGAVLGAVAGGAIGASVGSGSAQCDSTGYYYSYNQTMRYREPSDYTGRASGQFAFSHYRRNGCRLVAAPVRDDAGIETRYARVCPDNDGRYRLTE